MTSSIRIHSSVFRTFFVIIALVVFFLSFNAHTFTDLKCIDLLTPRLNISLHTETIDKMRDALRRRRALSRAGYRARRSGEGAIRVYDYLASRIFSLMSKDFNVLYITQRSRFSADESSFTMSHSRELNEPVKYHVVLEYKGYIVDPDFSFTEGPVPLRQYFQVRFGSSYNSSDADEMVFYSLPGEDYLHRLDYMMDISSIQRGLLENLTPKSISFKEIK